MLSELTRFCLRDGICLFGNVSWWWWHLSLALICYASLKFLSFSSMNYACNAFSCCSSSCRDPNGISLFDRSMPYLVLPWALLFCNLLSSVICISWTLPQKELCPCWLILHLLIKADWDFVWIIRWHCPILGQGFRIITDCLSWCTCI